jgi:hypothetical protein
VYKTWQHPNWDPPHHLHINLREKILRDNPRICEDDEDPDDDDCDADPAEYTTDLTNYSDVVYLGSLFIGSSYWQGTFVFDTGSNLLVVEDATCETCDGDNYDTTTSTEYEVDTVTVKTITVSANSAYLFLSMEVLKFMALTLQIRSPSRLKW